MSFNDTVIGDKPSDRDPFVDDIFVGLKDILFEISNFNILCFSSVHFSEFSNSLTAL